MDTPFAKALVLFLLATGAGRVVAAQEASSHVELPATLAEWKRQIEESGEGELMVARVFQDARTGVVTLPKDVPHRDVLVRHFRSQDFLTEFVATHAMNLSYKGPEGMLFFVLLHMGREGEWGAYQEPVVAHEFGHVWLQARNFPAPVYGSRQNACASIVGGNIVQHIVIRQELARRAIDDQPYWISKLEATLRALEPGVGELPPCRLLVQLGEWVDVRMGLSAARWEGYDRFEAEMNRNFPMLRGEVDALTGLLASQPVEDDQVHERVLGEVLTRVYRFAATLRGGNEVP